MWLGISDSIDEIEYTKKKIDNALNLNNSPRDELLSIIDHEINEDFIDTAQNNKIKFELIKILGIHLNFLIKQVSEITGSLVPADLSILSPTRKINFLKGCGMTFPEIVQALKNSNEALLYYQKELQGFIIPWMYANNASVETFKHSLMKSIHETGVEA
jgi:hypothetical protein